MAEAVVFAGTSDGRELCGFLAGRGVSVCMCVATEYGRALAQPQERVTVRTGAMDAAAMRELIKKCRYVADATHPYAWQATENIRQACAEAGVPYYRLLRPAGEPGACVIVENARQAAEYLRNTAGNVLLTTGSKDLPEYAVLDAARLYPRVLPIVESIARCGEIGVPQKNVICMQGPFSAAMNAATLAHVNAAFIVTKDSGNAGGVGEKIQAAEELGVTVILIGRPTCEEGYTMEQLKRVLTEGAK